jgi:hypothetical protein
MHKFLFIKEYFSEKQMGGDLDFLILNDDSVLIISDEYVGHYKSWDSWIDGDDEELNGFDRRNKNA